MRATRPHALRLRQLLLTLFCVVGLAGRFAAPIIALPAMAAAQFDAGICHADFGGGSGGDSSQKHAMDCQLCPFCHGAAQQAMLADMPSPVAVVSLWVIDRIDGVPHSVGPPGRATIPFQPRGPPTLSA